jgi:DNA-binding CsgD family transcriptional regulator
MAMATPKRRPVRLAIASDFEIVVAGVEGMLAAHRDRVVMVELPARGSMSPGVDVVLWDSSARPDRDGIDLRELAGQGAKLIAFDWDAYPASVETASTPDVSCRLSIDLTGLELVEAVESVCDIRAVGGRDPERGDGSWSGDWPGVEQGLTRREAEVLGLIARGLSNQEIANATYLSINSVKFHIRTAYRKLGVTRRSQAVGWGLRHGFASVDTRSREHERAAVRLR